MMQLNLGEKKLKELVKVCEDNEDGYSSMDNGFIIHNNKKFSINVLCVEIRKDSICELKRVKSNDTIK